MSEFGQYLRGIRGKRSLREMERLTGVSHVQLSNLEKGVDPRTGKRSEPSFETLTKISNTLNIPLNDLVAKAYIKTIAVGYLDDMQDVIYGSQPERKQTDILDILQNRETVFYNDKRLNDNDRQKVLDILKIILPEYHK